MTAYRWEEKYPKDVDWHAPIDAKPLHAMLDEAVATYSERPCLEFLGRTYSYAEIGRLVDRAAKGFQRLGVKPGVRIGLFLPNCPQYVISYFGILKAGGTVVNFNPLYAEREIKTQIEDSGIETMVSLDLNALYPKMAAMLAQTGLKTLVLGTLAEVLPFPKSLLFPIVKRKEIASYPKDERHLRFKELIDNDGAFAPVAIDAKSAVAVLQYTGGTTGVSKGAMLSHANLYANTLQSAAWFGAAEPGKERALGCLPFFHVFAMTVVMNMSLRFGAEIIMHPRFDLVAVLKDIAAKKATMFHGVPTMYTAIINHPELAKYDLSSIKHCISGGAPLPVEVKSQFEKLTGCKLVEGYGLTESSPVASCNPLHGENKTGSIGLPIPQTVIEVVDPEDPDRVLASGDKGEICIRGPQVMLGYWNRPEESARTIVNGRLHTGDLGYMDDDGYTFIIDRSKDLIISGGYNVYPRNVEEAIYLHPDVEEVTVIGIPDSYRGQVPKAFVKKRANAGLDAATLLSFLADKLAKFEIPTEVEFRDQLPKTLIGKLSKKELVEEEARKREKANAG